MADSALKLLQSVQDGIVQGEPYVISVVVAVVIGFLTLVWLLIKATSKNKRQGVLLLGICGAGKTVIYSQLVHKLFQESYTSIKTNSGSYTTPQKKALRIIDLPGHERLRERLLEEYKNLARAIVFVIDSGTLQKEVKEVAAYLYTLLSDRVISSNAPPLLILCNKQDLNLSKGAKVIKSQLEKEMTTLRITKSAALQGIGDTANNNTFLGKSDKSFEFSDLKPIRVEFAESSALDNQDQSGDSPGLEALHTWLAKIA